MSNAAKISALEAAIAKGITTVEADGRRVTYASIEAMLTAVAYFRQQDAGAQPDGSTYGVTLAEFGE